MCARFQTFVIGLAGPTASGKTTLAEWLGRLWGDRVLAVSCDGYYRDLSHLSEPERETVNFDHPDAIEHDLLAEHLAALRRGRAVDAPTYSFVTHTRRPEKARLEPRPIVVVEGLFVLHWPRVREQLDLRVFVDAPDAVCLARRIRRDAAERGRTAEECRRRYQRDVQPMAERFVLPSRRHADLVVDGRQPPQAAAEAVMRRATELMTAR